MHQKVQAQEPSGFCEMSIFKRLRKWCEHKLNCSGRGLERFLLVRRSKSPARHSARHHRPGDFSSMTLTPLIFALVILLFGFDSTRTATKSSRKKSQIF